MLRHQAAPSRRCTFITIPSLGLAPISSKERPVCVPEIGPGAQHIPAAQR